METGARIEIGPMESGESGVDGTRRGSLARASVMRARSTLASTANQKETHGQLRRSTEDSQLRQVN
jgi:hypothetical protein